MSKRLSNLFPFYICLMREGWVSSWTSPVSRMYEFSQRKLLCLILSRLCAGFCLDTSSSMKRQVLRVSIPQPQEAGPAKLPSIGLGFPRLRFHSLWWSQQEYIICVCTRPEHKRKDPGITERSGKSSPHQEDGVQF